jgi:hypothetical protein
MDMLQEKMEPAIAFPEGKAKRDTGLPRNNGGTSGK